MPIAGSSGGLSSGGVGGGGAQGPQGATGSQGNQGHQGTQGLQGAQGSGGSQGVQGAQGSTGAQGPQGAQGGTSVQGTPVIRAFPFAYNSPGILTGANLYTPTVGDILLDAWIEIDTAWNGTTPTGDYGVFSGGDGWQIFNGIQATDMSAADAVNVPGLLVASGSAKSNMDLYQQFTANAVTGVWSFFRGIPAKFADDTPVQICVSQDGSNTGADPGSTQGAGVLYLVTATPL